MEQTQHSVLVMKAYHEAGHAVAAYALHIRFALVTIMPGVGDMPDSGGGVALRWKTSRLADPRKNRQDGRRALTFLFAGEAGQYGMPREQLRQIERLPVFQQACDYDRTAATAIAQRLCGADTLQWVLHYMAHRSRAFDILQAEGWREALDAVARALIKQRTLRYGVTCRLIRTALTEAGVDRQMPSPMFL